MSGATTGSRDPTRGVCAPLSCLCTSTPYVLKRFGKWVGTAGLGQRARARFVAGVTKSARSCAVRSNCRAMLPQTRSHSA